TPSMENMESDTLVTDTSKLVKSVHPQDRMNVERPYWTY
ncbi:unnamed protein product, partial [marine sediment metagenome]